MIPTKLPGDITDSIIFNMRKDGKRYWAGDNISEYLAGVPMDQLIDNAAEKFDAVLDALLIDRHTDPNSKGTGRRLAKMYFTEIMEGRYTQEPDSTSFPNTGREKYDGMIVIRAELKSLCSHHHQTVRGVAYIGVLPSKKVIGLSKYIRIAQWHARRGTLQEELCNRIAAAISKATDSKDVAVYIAARHGCCENRGVEATSSLTQTTVIHGRFWKPAVKKEFFDNIALQQSYTEKL